MQILKTFADLFFLTLWMPLLWAVLIGLASGVGGRARIFHGKSIPTCGRTMPTALDSNFDWGGMRHTATASKLFFRLVSMGLARRLTTTYHEIFGLALTFLLAMVPVMAAAIYFGSLHASDESFLLAGVIPWSDAAAHFCQAAQMACNGVTYFGMNGRFLYPAFFSSLLNITGLNLLYAEIVSWIFFAIALVFLLRLTARLIGPAGAGVVALVSGLFFRERCAGLIMTENFGILCGLLAASAFLIALPKRNFWMLQLGIFILSLGLVGRPGPMFVLPFLIFYAGWVSWDGWILRSIAKWKRVAVGSMVAMVIVVTAFGSNALLSRSVYEGKVIANANFSFTLYGMLTGGKWSDALAWSHYNAPLVMQENIRLIKEEPWRLVVGAFRAYKEALYRRILFMFGHESRPATMLLILAVIGLVALWKQKEWRVYAWCMTLIAVGILLSIPFAPPWDAAERPFAVTIPFQALLAAIGLTRIFHGKSIPNCGRLMPTALNLNFDWDGMKHTATASKFFIRLVSMMLLALRLTTTFYDIFGLRVLQRSFFRKQEKEEEQKFSPRGYGVILLISIVFFLAVPLPLLHRIYFSTPLRVCQKAPVQLVLGSFIRITPENHEDFLQRLVPFLNHYPAEREFFSKLPQQVILGVDWKNKKFDHCAVLEGVKEVAPFHYWLVDQRLINKIKNG